MHRGRVADALLPQIVIEHASNIVVISEQYLERTDGEWFEDCTGTAAIWIPNGSPMGTLNSGRGNGFVWVKLNECFLMSCYLTPSDNIEDFQRKLDAIEDEMRNIGGSFIVAGDFNSRAIEWGSSSTNTRGRRILEMAARVGLAIANVGNTPTFRRPGCEGTIPDITLASETLAGRISGWKVLDIYTGSDHQYISYSLRTDRRVAEQVKNCTKRWNANKLDTVALISRIDRHGYRLNGDSVSVVKSTMDTITKACDDAMPKARTAFMGRQAVYWWNDSIAEFRRNCLCLRRNYTRARRQGPAEAQREAYKEAQKILRNAIKKSKRDKWEELRNDLNRDPWGLGYKLVMKKLGSKRPVEAMDDETMNNIVGTLFPSHNLRPADPEEADISTLSLFTEEELKDAAMKLKKKESPRRRWNTSRGS